MARRLAAVGFQGRGERRHVWRTEAGWFRAVSLAHPDATEGPFSTREEAMGPRRTRLPQTPEA